MSEENKTTKTINYVKGNSFDTRVVSGMATYAVPNFPNLIEVCFFNDRTLPSTEEFEEITYKNGGVQMKPTGQITTSFDRELVFSVQLPVDRIPKFIEQINQTYKLHMQAIRNFEVDSQE